MGKGKRGMMNGSYYQNMCVFSDWVLRGGISNIHKFWLCWTDIDDDGEKDV